MCAEVSRAGYGTSGPLKAVLTGCRILFLSKWYRALCSKRRDHRMAKVERECRRSGPTLLLKQSHLESVAQMVYEQLREWRLEISHFDLFFFSLDLCSGRMCSLPFVCKLPFCSIMRPLGSWSEFVPLV